MTALVGGGINQAQGQACRESAVTIVNRRKQENEGRAELYEWLNDAIVEHPLSAKAEEQLWNLLIRERPY